jgi:phospholipid/cholesterol/gamma-HCH transport system substrate-binding protein
MKPETKLGILTIVTLFGAIAFAYILGLFSPFSNRSELNVMYNYAGGIEVGSPVRVMGIKVGKITNIDFVPDYISPKGEEVKLKIKLEIDKKAWSSIKADSKFYINMAGVIGEKFLEISPGSLQASPVEPGAYLRGEDPPRVDQLISQSYGLAGKVVAMLEKNEGGIGRTIDQMDQLLSNFNKTLNKIEVMSRQPDLQKLMKNAVQISDDMAFLTHKIRQPETQETISLVKKLILRLEHLDGPAIKKFLQEEGIKAKLF